MKNWELYKKSNERFKRQQQTHGFMNWEVFYTNFKLESWNMKNKEGQIEPTIVQFWQDGQGYVIFRAEKEEVILESNIVNLNSVGSAIDRITKIVYPLLKSGEPSLNELEGTYLQECSEEWIENLSREDLLILTFL